MKHINQIRSSIYSVYYDMDFGLFFFFFTNKSDHVKVKKNREIIIY